MNETIKHLELIQGVINRMGQVSFLLKGWTVTLVVASFVFFPNSADWILMLFILAPICVFWGLDAFYLRQERLFICLYDAVRLNEEEPIVPFFSMDTSIIKSRVSSWWHTLHSRTIVGLYGSLCVIVLAFVIIVD